MRVLIADPCNISRLGVRSILDHVHYSAIAEATNVTDLLSCLTEGYDLLTLDPMICPCSVKELLNDIFRVSPRIKLLMLTDLEARKYGLEAFRAGVIGFLSKTCSAAQLIEAVDSVATGSAYITDKIADELFWFLTAENPVSSHDCLTNRELDIFALMMHGRKIGEIGKILQLSPKTVSTHKSRVLGKLQFSEVASLYQYAVDQNLVEELSVRSAQLLKGTEASVHM